MKIGKFGLSVAVLALASGTVFGGAIGWSSLSTSSAPSNAPAVAGNNPLIEIDEHGNGFLLFPGGQPIITSGTLQADPGPGGLSSVLTYNLLGPPSLVAGDVFLQDGVGGPILDVIRFNPAGTGSAGYPASVLFYSDNVDGFDALGDTSSPPGAFYANNITILEIGTEANNGATYTPLAGQPGYVAGFAVTYDFVSDGTVPEPATLGLSLAGIGLVAFKLRRRSARP